MPNDPGERIDPAEFRKWWFSTEMFRVLIRHFRISNSYARKYASKIGLPAKRPWAFNSRGCRFQDISQEEIQRRCLEIQKTWTVEIEAERRVIKHAKCKTPRVSYRGDHFVETSEAPVGDRIGYRLLEATREYANGWQFNRSGIFLEGDSNE